MEAQIYKDAWQKMEASANTKTKNEMKECLHQAMQEALELKEQESEENYQ